MMVMFMRSMYHVNGKINAQRYLIEDCFELALDDDNLVSLCFECHEIVEGRDGTWKKFKYKKKLTKEMW